MKPETKEQIRSHLYDLTTMAFVPASDQDARNYQRGIADLAKTVFALLSHRENSSDFGLAKRHLAEQARHARLKLGEFRASTSNHKAGTSSLPTQ